MTRVAGDELRRPMRWSGRTAIALVLAAGSIAVSSSLGSAASDPVVTQAALTQGLQRAVRVSPPPPPPPPPTTVPAPVMSAEEQAVFDQTNAARVAAGVAPLAFHPQLKEAAAIHGNDQRNKACAVGSLTHTGSDGSDAGDRIRRTGLSVRNWAENIACGYTQPESVMNGWMNSSGHRTNILNPALTHIGVSVVYSDSGRRYWVQVFGVPR